MTLPPPRLPHDLLYTLVTFSRLGSMSQTATALGVSQPAISLQFARMKTALKAPLLIRKGSHYELTPFAKDLTTTLSPLFDQIHNAVRRARLYHEDPANMEVHIGGRKELFGHLLGLANFPGKVIFHDLKSSDAANRLLDNKLDLALSQELPNVLHLKAKRLFSQSTRLLVHRRWLPKNVALDHRLALNRQFAYSTPWIVYNRNAGFIRGWLKSAKIKEKDLFVKAEVQDWTTIINLVKQGLGFALVPSGVTSSGPHVIEIPIPNSVIPARRFYLLYHPHLLDNAVLREHLHRLLTTNSRVVVETDPWRT